jgi:AcrR family transcriptional regulator
MPPAPRRKTATRTRKPASAAEQDGHRRKRRNREVVDAAAKVFLARGYADASVQDVADELGILKGSLYYYISTKEDLLFWLLEEVHEDVERILAEVEALEGLAPLARLHEYVRRQVEYNASNLAKISVYYHDIEQLGDKRREDIKGRRKAHERFVTSMIKQAQGRNEVDPAADPRVLANCVFAVMIWIYRWYRPGGKVKREQLARLLADFAVGGLTSGELAAAA